MNKQIAEKLLEKAKEVAKMFSNPDRAMNNNKETFVIDNIYPMSDTTAAVVYNKDSEKKAIAFFFFVESRGGWWGYFFPKDSHIVGMESFNKMKLQIEKDNFPKNFEVK